jgi:phosphoesterase RecJ-like protein
LDHHLGNQRYGKINLIDSVAPASSQVLFQFLKFCGLPCTPDVAANLFVGLSTDTGSFRFRQTSAESFRIAAELADTGIDVAALAQSCYQSHPPSRLKLLREVLNVLQFRFDHRVAFYHLTRSMFERAGSEREETEGLIEHIQSTESVEVAFVLEEIDPDRTRVSLRSRGRIDVNKLASQFGGGGHALAAGISASIPIAEMEARLLAELQKLLD